MEDDYSPFTVVKTLRNGKVSLSQLPEEAWTVSGAGKQGNKKALWRVVPFLKRGVEVVGQATADMPFTIYNKRGEEVTSSADYKDPTALGTIGKGWLPYPSQLFGLMAQSLMIYGQGYEQIERNTLRVIGLRWLAPTSMTPIFAEEGDQKKGVKAGQLLYFDRKLKRGTIKLKPEDVLHIWMPDPDVENGPPLTSNVDAAMLAAGAAESVDEFARKFFKGGAIKRTLFTLPRTVVEVERSRFKRWVKRIFSGLDTAWEDAVFFADAVTPTVVGEGLESLENEGFSKRLREDIATALGVPHSILFSNAASYATAEQDFRNLYVLTVVPLAGIIEQALNEQVFSSLGLTLRFDHKALDIFQEDEEDRTGALLNLLEAMTAAPPPVVVIGMQMLGIDLPQSETWETLQSKLEDNRRQREQEAQTQDRPQAKEPDFKPAAGTAPPGDEDEGKAVSPLALDLDRYRRKALKALKNGDSAAVSFESQHIDAASALLLTVLLTEAETPAAVERIFDVAV